MSVELPDYVVEENVVQEVQKVTRVGLRLPDGSVIWADGDQVIELPVGTALHRYSLVNDPEVRGLLVAALCRRAQGVGLPEASFVGLHAVVMQQRVTEVSVPVVVDSLVS